MGLKHFWVERKLRKNNVPMIIISDGISKNNSESDYECREKCKPIMKRYLPAMKSCKKHIEYVWSFQMKRLERFSDAE
jgi:hypothetical protein